MCNSMRLNVHMDSVIFPEKFSTEIHRFWLKIRINKSRTGGKRKIGFVEKSNGRRHSKGGVAIIDREA